MATLQIRHPALASAIRSRPDLRTALGQDPQLVHHVTQLDLFLMALAAEYPARALAERLVVRLLPSTQDLIAERHRCDAMARAVELTKAEGFTSIPMVDVEGPELVRPKPVTEVQVYAEGERDDHDPHRWPDLR